MYPISLYYPRVNSAHRCDSFDDDREDNSMNEHAVIDADKIAKFLLD